MSEDQTNHDVNDGEPESGDADVDKSKERKHDSGAADLVQRQNMNKNMNFMKCFGCKFRPKLSKF
jgi:hypothetical protein